MREGVQLAIRTNVEESARSVIGTGGEGVAVGEEPAQEISLSREVGKLRYTRNGVDVGFVAGEGLSGTACSDIPELGCSIASTRNEGVHIRSQGQAYHGNS